MMEPPQRWPAPPLSTTVSSDGNSRSSGSVVGRHSSRAGVARELLTEAASQHIVHKEARRQVCFTLCGAGTLVLSFMFVGAAFLANFLTKQDVLHRKAQSIQKGVADKAMHEVALTLKEAYTSTRRLAEQASLGKARKDGVWPPTWQSFVYGYEQLLSNLWVQLETDLHLREVDGGGQDKDIIPFLGLSTVVALRHDGLTFASSMEECAHVLRVALYAAEGVGSGGLWPSGSPHKLAQRTRIFTDREGAKVTRLEMRHFHVGNYSLLPEVLAEAEGLGCEHMEETWGHRPVQPALDNFSWFGPTLDGPGYKAMHGDVPLYSEDGQRKIGFFSSIFSVAWSLRAALPRIIKDSGEVTNGAEFAIVSESGLLLGASEFDADQVSSLSDIPKDTLLEQAVRSTKYRVGTVCPQHGATLEADGRIVDVFPFGAESYGLPPLNERWCLIQTFPRQNIFEAIDYVQTIKIITGSFLAILVSCSVVLFMASLYVALVADRRLRTEKFKADLQQVSTAVHDVERLSSPMVVVSASTFLQLTKLEHYEALRDQGLVTVLDSLGAIASFRSRNMIVFLSHQWLSLEFPDVEEAVQLQAMQGAIRTVLAAPARERGVYVWCDFVSIAQRHTKMQQASISSLPVYARVADKFIMVAPSAIHADFQCECNLSTYNERGWCRAEMLAKACGSGIAEMYACTDADGTLSAITVEDLAWLSLNVFAGHFTVQEDAEDLVKPVLGLYSLVLRQRHLPHMAVLHEHIEKDKATFFPRSYYSRTRGEEVELFGQCLKLLETSIERGDVFGVQLQANVSVHRTPHSDGGNEAGSAVCGGS